MTDPLSVSASVAGLVALAETFIQLASAYAMDVKSCPTDFKNLTEEVEGLCGVLLTLERVIQKLPRGRVAPTSNTPDGFHPAIEDIMLIC